MARNKQRTTKKMFDSVHTLYEEGNMPQQEIAERMNIGENRVSCILKFKTFKEFENGRTKVYESWRKKPRQTKKKKEEENKPIDMAQDIHDLAREARNIKSILMKIAEAWEVKI